VLHGADLTYAVAAPADALPEGLAGSYRAVSDALAAALRRLGVEAARAEPGARLAPDAGFDCFAEPAEDELVVEGRKLAGSAQRRVGGALLQHGSIRLAPDPPAAARLAGVGAAATSLGELGLDPEAARRALCEMLPSALAGVLGADVEAGVLEPAEAADAERRAAALERDPLARRAGPASRAL
jgi:lipoate-protein ligase A